MPSEAELRRGENPAVAWVDTNDRGRELAGMLTGGIFRPEKHRRNTRRMKDAFRARIVSN